MMGTDPQPVPNWLIADAISGAALGSGKINYKMPVAKKIINEKTLNPTKQDFMEVDLNIFPS